jgi:serine/threonine-protein kinase
MGGRPQPVTTLDSSRRERDHHAPELLPGGRALLFTVHEEPDVFRIGVRSLSSTQHRVLIDQGFDAHYLPTGHLVYANGKSVFAVPFELQTLEVVGDPVKLLDDVGTTPDSGIGGFTLSKNGSIVFLPERPRTPARTLVWVDRSGAETPLPLAARPFTISRLSPDGRQIAFTVVTSSSADTADIWTYDIATERARRASFDKYSVAPMWTPDGRRLTYTTSRGDTWHLLSVPADGSTPPQSFAASRNQIYAAAWTADGRTLLYNELQPGRTQIAATEGAEPRVLPLDHGPSFANVGGPSLSPDGRWLAFVGTESGRNIGNIYVEPFQRPGPRYQVTVDGGIQPLWRRDGREMFYRNGDGVYSVAIETGREFVAGKPALLFRGLYRRGAANTPDYDVTADGRRFLMVKMGDDELAPRRLNVVVNWVDELSRRVPTARR